MFFLLLFLRILLFLLISSSVLSSTYCSSLYFLLSFLSLLLIIFIIGEDWGRDKHNIDVENYLKSRENEIIKVSYNPKTSSTKIKQTVIAQLEKSDHY